MPRLFCGLLPVFVFFLSVIAQNIAVAEETAPYPIIIKHAFGTTTIAKKPERVATVAWANHEVPLALGIVPVGFAAANFGDDDGDGLLPWVAKRLAELDASKPVLFDEGDGIDFEAVAATQPDVILAAYSGLSQSDYDTLSQIAPVVAYPVSPWATDWRDMIRLNSAGLGMAAEGEALIRRIEGENSRGRCRPPATEGQVGHVCHPSRRHKSQRCQFLYGQ
ncbi:UNVERIFIED_ORG: ABC-type Fe3+-hydroxamate transport system substrate-binding protein [Rhizobium sp. SORGH_AS 755]|nr:ABC-type Fe3+-hydroxamate transport system substrate-binding protein [Rhizobium sp. SORGH_AS_0755]